MFEDIVKDEAWQDFINSLAAGIYRPCYKHKVLMNHTPVEVRDAKEKFEKYLTDYELQEEQLTGRYWAFGKDAFYILLDNELALRITFTKSGIKDEVVYRDDYKTEFPDELRGCYYNE